MNLSGIEEDSIFFFVWTRDILDSFAECDVERWSVDLFPTISAKGRDHFASTP